MSQTIEATDSSCSPTHLSPELQPGARVEVLSFARDITEVVINSKVGLIQTDILKQG